MDIPVFLANQFVFNVNSTVPVSEILSLLQLFLLQADFNLSSFYFLQNGKKVDETNSHLSSTAPLHAVPRLYGGKGGFGSMLRAIGAQIEKTTNRDACRDLSGRRLRDINEEKMLKAWLEKEKDTTTDAYAKRKKKLERLLQAPKHEFKDEDYEQARSDLATNVSEAFDQGFLKTQQPDAAGSSKTALKRKIETTTSKPKAKKSNLWIADDLSSCDSSDSSDEDEPATVKAGKSCKLEKIAS